MVDGIYSQSSRWTAANSDLPIWLDIDFGEDTTFNKVVLTENIVSGWASPRIASFNLQIPTADGYQTIYTYPHKILTGRKAGYIDGSRFSEDSGYTNPEESEHDLLNIGHTSTSIALATGLAKARDLKGDKRNVIAVIGDGSLSGGEAMEALNVTGSELNSNFIIVVNDNEMAIAETHGGLYKDLVELRETNGQVANNLFKAFGLDYLYVRLNICIDSSFTKQDRLIGLATQNGGFEILHFKPPFSF